MNAVRTLNFREQLPDELGYLNLYFLTHKQNITPFPHLKKAIREAEVNPGDPGNHT